MLTCHNCMRRCLQTLIGDSALVSTLPRGTIPSNRQGYTSRELHTEVKQQPYPARFKSLDTFEKEGKQTFGNPKEKKNWESTSHRRQQWLESRGKTPISKQRQKAADDPLLKRQLQHLKDPLKLAEHVRATLRENDFESALAIVQAASKDTQCVVSWNHLIDWQLSKNRMNDAIKTYNQMKKRAQTPDAYTYTIIFRGCAQHPQPAQALAKVITIYTSMLAEKAPVHPNTIHMNAILKMCAKADDMEALFAISENMPSKGARSPDMVTYSVVLNAVRIHAFDSLRGDLTMVQRHQIRQNANMHARRIWSDIAKRWRQGDFMIDESLVCIMGRILLLGVEQDVDDVLSLIEQTMGIPRQASSLISRYSREATPPAAQDEVRLTTTSPHDVEETNPFAVAQKSSSFYVTPGQNTLSLVMEALLDLRLKEPSTKYWEILTKKYAVDPDANNYHAYLRVLRSHRASTETVKLLFKMPPSYMERKTFRIAMSTCRRDGNNQHAFANAGKVLDIMQTSFRVLDPLVISEYLHVAFSVSAYNGKVSSNGEHAESKYAQGKQIMRALERINPSYINLRSLLAYGDPSKAEGTGVETQPLSDSVLALTQNLVRAHDMLLHKQMVSREQTANLIAQRSKLAAFITRFRGKHKNALRPATPEATGKDVPLGHKINNPRIQSRMADVSVRRNFSEKFAEEEERAAEAALSYSTPPSSQPSQA